MDSNDNQPEVQHEYREYSDFRYVGLTRLTPINPYEFPADRIEWLWGKVSSQDYAFDDLTRGQVEPFIAGLFVKDSMHYLIGDAGYILVRNLNGINPDIHFTIWDKQMKFRDIIEAGKELISHVFKFTQCARVTGLIPTYNERAKKFSTLLGFKYEGELRNATVYYGKKYGIQIYGLLREEHDRWGRTQ